MARQPKKAPKTPVRDAILADLARPSLDRLWPLPKAYKCSRCGMAILDLGGSCKRTNKHGARICKGYGIPIPVFRARCRCTSWTVSESQLLSRCSACHRRIEEWDEDYLLTILTRKERGGQAPPLENEWPGPRRQNGLSPALYHISKLTQDSI